MLCAKIYQGDALAPLVRWGIAPAWAQWEGSQYLKHARKLRRTQYDAPPMQRERQWHALKTTLLAAYQTTSFYRKRLDAVGLSPHDIQTPGDLSAIPVLTKHDLRQHAHELHANGFASQQCHLKRTSGSTGVSVEVVVDEPAHQFKRACTLRSDEWSGWRLGEPVACVWGNPEYVRRGWRGRLRNRLLERACYLDTLKMTAPVMQQFVFKLRQSPPSLLFGHAHSLYLLAKYCQGIGGAAFRPKGIISTAMVLHSWERRTIEEVFQAPVTNRYGCEEVSLIACECEQHQGLHINSDGVYVETLRADGSHCDFGEIGAIVVTDLANRAMPLIRYQVGDMAALSDHSCPCGRGLPLIERLEGRVADYVVTPAGELISGISLTENFAMLLQGAVQLQIVQETLDCLRFRIVRDVAWNRAAEDRLAALVVERFGPAMRFECEFLESIPQEPSGKYRFCISKVPHPLCDLSAPSA